MVTATTPPTLLGSIAVAPIVTGEANLSVSSGSALAATATATLATPTVKQFVPYVVLT
jgi:ribose/xylose/arabinose/galactoside ABC-type transport system permease subunit